MISLVCILSGSSLGGVRAFEILVDLGSWIFVSRCDLCSQYSIWSSFGGVWILVDLGSWIHMSRWDQFCQYSTWEESRSSLGVVRVFETFWIWIRGLIVSRYG